MMKRMMYEEYAKQDIVEQAAQYVCPDRVKTFRQMGAVPVMARREGNYFWDMDGRKLFDVHINGGTYNLGHRNPELIATYKDNPTAPVGYCIGAVWHDDHFGFHS